MSLNDTYKRAEWLWSFLDHINLLLTKSSTYMNIRIKLLQLWILQNWILSLLKNCFQFRAKITIFKILKYILSMSNLLTTSLIKHNYATLKGRGSRSKVRLLFLITCAPCRGVALQQGWKVIQGCVCLRDKVCDNCVVSVSNSLIMLPVLWEMSKPI